MKGKRVSVKTDVDRWEMSGTVGMNMKTVIGFAVVLAFGAIGTAGAQEVASAASPAPRASEIGHATLAWLDLQRSDAEAGREPTMLGAEATLLYTPRIGTRGMTMERFVGANALS